MHSCTPEHSPPFLQKWHQNISFRDIKNKYYHLKFTDQLPLPGLSVIYECTELYYVCDMCEMHHHVLPSADVLRSVPRVLDEAEYCVWEFGPGITQWQRIVVRWVLKQVCQKINSDCQIIVFFFLLFLLKIGEKS